MEKMNDGFPMNTSDQCRIMVKVLDYVETRPNGLAKLEQFLLDDGYFYGVNDAQE